MSENFNPRPLGRSQLIVPDVCLGTMTFGEQTGEADAHSQLDLALAAASISSTPPRCTPCRRAPRPSASRKASSGAG